MASERGVRLEPGVDCLPLAQNRPFRERKLAFVSVLLVNGLLLNALSGCGSEGGAEAESASDTDGPHVVEAGTQDVDVPDEVSDEHEPTQTSGEAGAGSTEPATSVTGLPGMGTGQVAPPVASEDPILINDSDAGVLHCERELSFEAVTLAEPEPFDVVIVADHSDSISWSRDDLANGLSSLLDEIYGYDARFFVLTPTQYGASAAAAVDFSTGMDLVLWRDPTSGQVYDHEVTHYSQSCTDEVGQARICPTYPATDVAFAVDGHFQFMMPQPVSAITREMDTDELQAQKQRLVDAIVNLGGHAAQTEQPMCTLNRYIKQAPELLPKHAVFVVISDEDDTSSPNDCIESYHYSFGPYAGLQESGGCTTDCDFWRTVVWRTTVNDYTNFRCVPVDDFGVTFPEQGYFDSDGGAALQNCADFDSTCNDLHLARAAEICGAGHVVEQCSRSCTENGSRPGCSVDLLDQGIDACTQAFESEGEQYDNVIDYCQQRTGASGWGECERDGMTLEQATSWTTAYARTPLVPAADVLDMIRTFQVSATNAFGEDGFYVATIAFDPSFECTPEAGQSHATTLRMVSKGPKDVFPICESYAPVLSKVTGFAKTLLPTDYGFELGTNESIEAVTIQSRDGRERKLEANEFSYDADAHNLHVEASAVKASDVSLNVTLVDPCARQVH